MALMTFGDIEEIWSSAHMYNLFLEFEPNTRQQFNVYYIKFEMLTKFARKQNTGKIRIKL